MLYQRGKEKTWWYRFRFGGRIVHESARTQSKTVAREAEKQRRRQHEVSWNQITRRTLPPTFEKAASAWLASQEGRVAPNTVAVAKTSLKHLREAFGSRLLCDITAGDVSDYQQKRLRESAQGKTVNIELGVFRQIMKAHDCWSIFDGKIKSLSQEVTGNQVGTVAKAKAAYDYLFTTMRYDKTGTGWGRGDALWACDSKHGNCTDFHSPFIGMLRADNIPARFDIGFPVPENKDKGDISGYHCWAEFYASKIGWIPVDISEAWKAKEKKGYFFGSLDANRVKFSTGRDITLSPKQDGPPLNYFVYPYVEVDGKPYEGVSKQFSFEELKAGEQKASGSKTPAGSPRM